MSSATITLRNELGTSLPLILDRFTRTDIFSAITRDPHSVAGETSSSSSSSETAWIAAFYRGRFSAKLHLTSTGTRTDPSAVTPGTTTITFLICAHDSMSPLSDSTCTKKPSFRASQKFISPQGTSPRACSIAADLCVCGRHPHAARAFLPHRYIR